MLLAFWTSFLVRAFAWIVMLGRNGVVNQLLTALGLQDAPADLLYSLGAVLVGHGARADAARGADDARR